MAQGAQCPIDDQQHDDADHEVAVRMVDESIAETVDGIEERIELADVVEQLGQALDRIEGARQEGQRRDDEIGA